MIPTVCPECKTSHEVRPQKCSSCGYPFEINGEDRAKVIAQQVLQKRALTQGKSAAKSVRIMLWVLATLNLLGAFYLKQYSLELFYIQLIAVTVLVGFSLLTYVFPIIAVILTLLSFTFLYIILPLITNNTDTILNGMFIKIIILSILAFALVRLVGEHNTKKKLQ